MSQTVLELNEVESCCCFTTVDRACLYRYVELVFAEADDPESRTCQSEVGEAEFLLLYSKLMDGVADLSVVGMRAARRHFAKLSRLNRLERRAAYKAITVGAADCASVLQDALALADFYYRSGVEVSADSESLANRLCVQLQFLQLLCLREDEAARRADRFALRSGHATTAEFLDRFLLPLVCSLTDISDDRLPDNPYGALLEATRCLILQHRRMLGPVPAWTAGMGISPFPVSTHVTSMRSSS